MRNILTKTYMSTFMEAHAAWQKQRDAFETWASPRVQPWMHRRATREDRGPRAEPLSPRWKRERLFKQLLRVSREESEGARETHNVALGSFWNAGIDNKEKFQDRSLRTEVLPADCCGEHVCCGLNQGFHQPNHTRTFPCMHKVEKGHGAFSIWKVLQ